MKVKELEAEMLAARQAYHDFMDTLKRPMNEDEKKNYKTPRIFSSFNTEAEQTQGQEYPDIIELTSKEQAEEMMALEKEMHRTYAVFVREYSKIEKR